jgi:hypothetical protein
MAWPASPCPWPAPHHWWLLPTFSPTSVIWWRVPPPSSNEQCVPPFGEDGSIGIDLMCWDFSSPSIPCATSPLPPMRLSGGLSEEYSIAARRRAAKYSDPIQTDILPQSRLDQRLEVIIYHRTCVSTRRRCPLWRHSRCTRIYTTLRSATSASSSTLVRERSPRVWSQGYVT